MQMLELSLFLNFDIPQLGGVQGLNDAKVALLVFLLVYSAMRSDCELRGLMEE